LRIIRKTETVMTQPSSHEQTRLLAGVIAHVSRYLDTGCPRAAHQAALLLRCLDGGALDPELMTSCEELDRVISLPRPPQCAGATRTSPASRRPRVRSMPASASVAAFPN
jgi:hypothetical protein